MPPPKSRIRAKSSPSATGKILDDGKLRPLAVKVGDRVLFGKYSGQTVKVDGEELLVMREEDIMGVVEA
jgi:chaperonin GroES